MEKLYMSDFNALEVKDRIVDWIRDWFENNGKLKNKERVLY